MDISSAPSQRIRTMSRILAYLCRFAIVFLAAYYLANVTITVLHPLAPNIGSSSVQRAEDGRVISHSYSGMTRAYIKGAGPDKSPLLNLNGSIIPLTAMTSGSWILYLAILTVGSVVILKFLFHLRKLFLGFAEGDIFSTRSIRQIKGLGVTVLLWALAEFLLPFAVMAIYHLIVMSSEVNVAINYALPLDTLLTGLLIWFVALVFEEGRRLQEESVLTV